MASGMPQGPVSEGGNHGRDGTVRGSRGGDGSGRGRFVSDGLGVSPRSVSPDASGGGAAAGDDAAGRGNARPDPGVRAAALASRPARPRGRGKRLLGRRKRKESENDGSEVVAGGFGNRV